jgi:hypothetical protein
MLQIVFLFSFESSQQGERCMGFWFHDVWTCGTKVLEYWMISSLKFKVNRNWKFQRNWNWNLPLVLVETSWWTGLNAIWLVRFGFRMWEILKGGQSLPKAYGIKSEVLLGTLCYLLASKRTRVRAKHMGQKWVLLRTCWGTHWEQKIKKSYTTRPIVHVEPSHWLHEIFISNKGSPPFLTRANYLFLEGWVGTEMYMTYQNSRVCTN